MLYQLSYFRKNRPYQSYPFPHTVSRRRRACNSNRHSFLWEVMDSNHRRRTPADLQSAPFGHSGICPYFFVSCCSFVQPLACGCRRCAAVLAYLPPVCSTCCYFILRENPTILMAVTAYSSPLFPSRPPERSSACSWLFVVRSPKITGTSPSAFSCDKPLETAWHI